jgi:signal transduction histidine kinase
MAEEIAEAWSPVCSRRGVTMQVDVPHDLWVTGTASELYRLFYDLVDNAVTHSPPGGRVVLSAAAEPPWVHVTIADDGPVIAAEDSGRVFDRSYRGTGAIQETGSDLGLNIARKIAAAHGGQITLVDSVNGGRVLRVTLPHA